MKPTDLDDPTPLEPDDDALARTYARSRSFRRRRTSRRLGSVATGLIVVVLAVGIAFSRVDSGNDRVTTPVPTATTTTTPAAAPSLATAIVGPWEPVSIAGRAGPHGVEIRFGDSGSWSGYDGCNTTAGTYQLGPAGSFHLVGGPKTLRGCTDAKTGREVATPPPYAATRAEIADGRLRFLAADGRQISTYKRERVSTRVELPLLDIHAGSSMSGRVVVDNDTGQVLHAVDCISYFQVVLGNAHIHQQSGWPLCAQNLTFPVGESSYPVTIDASYLGCAGDGPHGSLPKCLPGGSPPPLPPGAYRARLFQSGDVVPEPAPITVQVTPACSTAGSDATPPQLPASAGIGSLPELTKISSGPGGLPPFKGSPGSRNCYAPVAGLIESWLLTPAITHYGSAANVPLPIPPSIASKHPGPAEVNLTVLAFDDPTQATALLADPVYNSNPDWTTVAGQRIRDGNVLKVDSLANGGLSEFIVQRVAGNRWIDLSVVGADLTVAQAEHIADSVGAASHS